MNEHAALATEGVGYLTMRDWNRARWAVEYSRNFLPWLRVAGYVNFTPEDIRVNTTATPHIGIPATKLAYLEIMRLIEELQQWHELEDAAHDQHGQYILTQIGRDEHRRTPVANGRPTPQGHRDAMRRMRATHTHVPAPTTRRRRTPSQLLVRDRDNDIWDRDDSGVWILVSCGVTSCDWAELTRRHGPLKVYRLDDASETRNA